MYINEKLSWKKKNKQIKKQRKRFIFLFEFVHFFLAFTSNVWVECMSKQYSFNKTRDTKLNLYLENMQVIWMMCSLKNLQKLCCCSFSIDLMTFKHVKSTCQPNILHTDDVIWIADCVKWQINSLAQANAFILIAFAKQFGYLFIPSFEYDCHCCRCLHAKMEFMIWFLHDVNTPTFFGRIQHT